MYRCIYNVLEWKLYVYFPSFQSVDTRISTTRQGRCESHTSLPKVAHNALVRQTSSTASRRSSSTPARLPLVASRPRQEAPAKGKATHARMHSVGQAYTRRGLTTPVIDFLLDSWRTGNQRQYDVYITRWVDFCTQKGINMFDPNVDLVLQFLLDCFNTGLSYSTINTVRSA